MSRYPSQTKKGVRQASYAIILFMVANALGIVFILALMPLLAEVLTLPPGGVPSAGFFGGLIAVAAAGCGLLVVELAGAPVWAPGVGSTPRSKGDWGPGPTEKVDHAVLA